MLWRALKDIQGGFYIDVGAQDPRSQSVSRGFYEMGWRGISVEPVPYYYARLKADRPDETIFRAAVSTSEQDIEFFEFPETGLSTANRAIAEMHLANGFSRTLAKVPVMSLSAVLSAAGDRDIHWLKIDVEGMEDDVVASWGRCEARPWIVVVESTLPTTRTQSHEVWEPQLLARGYGFVYFDGLNRYYCLLSRPDLAAHFGLGPNVFDTFQISLEACAPGAGLLGSAISSSKAEIVRLEAVVGSLTRDLASARAAYAALQAEVPVPDGPLVIELEGLRRERDHLLGERALLAAIHASTSWKITAPLRALTRVLRGEGRDVARRGFFLFKRCLMWALVRLSAYLSARPRLKQFVLDGLDMIPALRDRLRRAMAKDSPVGYASATEAPVWALAAEPDRIAAWKSLLAEPNNPRAS